ncbi:MAG: amidohydrolase family protein [Bacillota bacterium]|nr:amidohydrolase family protein [Bacillota bacterium]
MLAIKGAKVWTMGAEGFLDGATVLIDHPVVSIRDLRLQAGIACRHGLNEKTALQMITINAARIMGLDSRLGSLEPGKDADFVVFSGHPLESMSRVEAVYIDGANVLGGR